MTDMPQHQLLSRAPTDELAQLPVNEIILGELARALDEAAVESWVESIQSVGLLPPSQIQPACR